MIKVLFFARLREQLNCEGLELDCADLSSVTDVHQHLLQQYPGWANFLEDRKLLVAVNQTLVKPQHPIAAGDEVAFFPPVTGG